jgi:carbon storage regulator CsrA
MPIPTLFPTRKYLMLVLSRKIGEEIIIGDNIRVTVVAIRNNHVRLGFTAPNDVTIFRSEIVPHAESAPEEELCHAADGGR